MALWRKPFELMVDNVLYLGVPMPCHANWAARARRSAATAVHAGPSTGSGSTESDPANLADDVAASLFNTQPAVRDVHSIKPGTTSVTAAVQAPAQDKADLDMFHVVFVLDVDKVLDDTITAHDARPAPEANQTPRLTKSAVIDVAQRVAQAFQAENARSGYMTQQVQQLLEARAAWLAASPTSLRDVSGRLLPPAAAPPLHMPVHSRTLTGPVTNPPLRSSSSALSDRGSSVPPPLIHTGAAGSSMGTPPALHGRMSVTTTAVPVAGSGSRAHTGQSSGHPGQGSGGVLVHTHQQVVLDTDELLRSLLHSPLANDLVRVFHAVQSQNTLRLRINGWTTLCLRAHSGAAGGAAEHGLRMYHTLLLHRPRSTVMASLPPDGSSALRQLVFAINPSRSLGQLALDIGADLPTVIDMGRHLVAWGACSAISVLHRGSRFVLTAARTSAVELPQLAQEFSATFPGRTLPSALGNFQSARAIGDVLSELDTHRRCALFIQITLWLLKKGLVAQVCSRLRFVPCRDMPAAVSAYFQGCLLPVGVLGPLEQHADWVATPVDEHLEQYIDGEVDELDAPSPTVVEPPFTQQLSPSPPPPPSQDADADAAKARLWLIKRIAQRLQSSSGTGAVGGGRPSAADDIIAAASACVDSFLCVLPYCNGSVQLEEAAQGAHLPLRTLTQLLEMLPDMLTEVAVAQTPVGMA